MDLTLDQAAVLMGQTVRQVRYLLKTGRLRARKEGARWVVSREDLPLKDGALLARHRTIEQLRAASDQVLGPPVPAPVQALRGTFGLGSLRAWQVGGPLLAEVRKLLPPEHPAVVALRDGLLAVARGCHRYHPVHNATRSPVVLGLSAAGVSDARRLSIAVG